MALVTQAGLAWALLLRPVGAESLYAFTPRVQRNVARAARNCRANCYFEILPLGLSGTIAAEVS